jgi:hypothetical protein
LRWRAFVHTNSPPAASRKKPPFSNLISVVLVVPIVVVLSKKLEFDLPVALGVRSFRTPDATAHSYLDAETSSSQFGRVCLGF